MINLKSELTKIAGEKNVLDDPAILENYSKDSGFSRPMKPKIVIKVTNADQVQKVVKLANITQTPLIPVSSGFPHYKGDTVASIPESVIVDLSGMKKILSINRQHRMCVIEPGVTYGELLEVLQKEGLTVETSLAPKSTKSVLASVLDGEPRINAMCQYDFFDPLKCMEVIWGDGNRMYTGEAAQGPLDLKKQHDAEKWQIAGSGPFSTDFLRMLTQSQGTMGIVTWASIRCEILPAIQKMFFVPAKKPEELIEFVRKVVRLRFSDGLFILNNAQLAALLAETSEEIQALKKELPAWVALVGVLGRTICPEERIESQELDIADIAQHSGLRMLPSLPGINGETILNKVKSPSKEVFWKETLKGSFEDIFFLTTLDKTTEFITEFYRQAEESGYCTNDIGVYIQPKHRGSSYHIEFTLPYNRNDIKESGIVKDLYENASKKLCDMGAYFSRPHGPWSKMQLNKDAQSAIFIKDLKGIFDPNNIMNPGKLTVQ